MVVSTHPHPFTYLVQKPITIFRTEGLASLAKRIGNRLSFKPLQGHCFVYENKFSAELPMPICEVELEFKEMTAADADEIDELIRVDEWHSSKSSILKRLQEGEHIHIAKHKARIVATMSIVTRDNFEDIVFRREYKIAPNEAYYWRAFCAPAYRGRGIIQPLVRYSLNEMAVKYGRNNGLSFIMTSNKSSQRAASKIGWVKVGRAGFVEIFGFRFHYLWGREAFKETRERFSIRNMG